MDYIVRHTTGGMFISYGYWLGCAWWEVYTEEYNEEGLDW